MKVKKSLKILSRIWGNREGYAFLPWIDGDSPTHDKRRRNYHEGRAFKWPEEHEAIYKHMKAHTKDDLYFCPNLFDMKRRSTNFAREERALWADLDDIHPESIDQELRPTIAWASSPGSFQAVWLLTADALLASEAGGLGQRLTYYLNADLGGWDATQLLRPPGWRNHKVEYKEDYGEKGAPGKLLWWTGPRYHPKDIDSLVPELTVTYESSGVLEQELDQVDRFRVMSRISAKLPTEVKRLLRSRTTAGADRSQKLFYIEQSLAEAGCTLSEIIAIVRPTVWNKFAGRDDELKRLKIEAGKAIEKYRREEEEDSAFEVVSSDEIEASNWFIQTANVPEVNWLIQDIWTQGSCGMIGGVPKTYKSFFALDLAVAVAAGSKFLNHFRVNDSGPVFFCQEEDSLALIRRRLTQIVPSHLKDLDPENHNPSNADVWYPPTPMPEVFGPVRQNINLAEGMYREWLDEELSKRDYKLLILDPMMFLTGTLQTNRSEEMAPHFFQPLKQMAEKHGCAIILLHHLGKSEKPRVGQKLLGSTAGHAWTEDSLFLRKERESSPAVKMTRETKFAESKTWQVNIRFRGPDNAGVWAPEVVQEFDLEALEPENTTHRALIELGPGSHDVKTILSIVDLAEGTVRKHLSHLKKEGFIANPERGRYRANHFAS